MGASKFDKSLVISFIVAGVVSRLVPHPANMALVTGAAIFAGSKLGRLEAMLVPLIIMLVSDLIIGFHSTMLFTWGAFALIGFMAGSLRNKSSFFKTALVTGLSSIVFFVISNFGVWLASHMYPLTGSGLIACFINALPFSRNTIFGDAIYTAGIFGIYEALRLVFVRKNFAIV